MAYADRLEKIKRADECVAALAGIPNVRALTALLDQLDDLWSAYWLPTNCWRDDTPDDLVGPLTMYAELMKENRTNG